MPPSGITERSEVTVQGATVFLIFLSSGRTPVAPRLYTAPLLPSAFKVMHSLVFF